MDHTEGSFQKIESRLIDSILYLFQSDSKWLGQVLVKGLRLAWRRRPAPTEGSHAEETVYPTGPYALTRRSQMGDLLLWVPRRINSFLINDLTGRFGYSHVSVDTGEVDVPSGKPVMVEVQIGHGVEIAFQDEFGGRSFARIPLSRTGLDVETFAACVKSKVGEAYDNLEALTLGEIDDPARQMCSGLVSDCLPESLKREFARARRLGLLRRSSVSVHSHPNAPQTKIFISPNGFAEYFGAPKGEDLHGTDIPVEPRPLKISVQSVARRHGWKAGVVLGGVGALAAAILVYSLTKSHARRP